MGHGFLNLKLHPNLVGERKGEVATGIFPDVRPPPVIREDRSSGRGRLAPLGLSKDELSVLLGQARPPPGSTPPRQGLFLLPENRPE